MRRQNHDPSKLVRVGFDGADFRFLMVTEMIDWKNIDWNNKVMPWYIAIPVGLLMLMAYLCGGGF